MSHSSRVTLSLACCDYDRTQALFQGTIGIEGCDVVPVALHPEQAFHRAFRYQEFDVTELSMSAYMAQMSRGTSPYVGIPVFPSRAFRHSAIYVRTDRGIASPQDLRGRLVGLPGYQLTAAVWIRGILQDEYDVTPAELRWRVGGQEQPGRGEMVRLALPAGIEVEAIPAGSTLSQMLDDGELDAMIGAKAPSCFGRNPKVARLFPNYREVEAAYYAKTRLFPIMHLVGVRRTLVERHPWLPASVYGAFLQAKAVCYRNQAEIGQLYTTLPWPVDDFERARALMGDDFWRYGVAENQGEIDALTRYSFEQGLSARKLEATDLFAASTFELAKL